MLKNTSAAGPKAKRGGFFLMRVRRMLYGLIGIYAGICGALMWFENKILYPAPRTTVGDWNKRTQWGAEEANFEADDKTKLHGWYFPKDDAKRVMLLCHGNGENTAMAAHEAMWLRDKFDASVLVWDYRGYGKSEGKPSEQGIYQDGEAAVQWLAKRAGVKTSELYLVGRSLGSGVVVEIGVKHQVKAIILLSPFAEMPDPAASKFWFVPVRFLMKNRYASVKKIPNFQGGTFITHGDQDDLVPQWSGKRLYDAAPEPKRWVPIAGAGHNDISLIQCEQELRAFLAEIEE
jgi:fermentation-respiration switch protein FrsA (DUF1100 family)